MVSNLFSIRFTDSSSPSAEVAVPGRDAVVREYFAGPENALLRHVSETDFIWRETGRPFMLFGPSGTGKSHLLRGLVDRFTARHPDARTRLLGGSDFCREFSSALEVGSISDVRQRLCGLDCFALDDVHLLAEKPYAQQELASLLDSWENRQATILMTSSVSPYELRFPPGLSSRLCGGLTVPIQLPGRTTRQHFVRQFAAVLEIDLTDDVITFLSTVDAASIPELRGLLLQVRQTSVEEGRPIDIDLISHVITQRAGTGTPGVRHIIKKVAQYFGLTSAELTGPSRRQTTVLARNAAIFLTRQIRKDSFEQIGSYFGGRDHSTVMHAFQNISKKRDDPQINAVIVELGQRLGIQQLD